MKKLAALAVIASVFALSAPDMGAEAKVKFRIKDRHHDNYRDRHRDDYKISCNTARHMVRDRGFTSVKAKRCIATVHQFWAVKKGHTYIVHVHSRNGFVWVE